MPLKNHIETQKSSILNAKLFETSQQPEKAVEQWEKALSAISNILNHYKNKQNSAKINEWAAVAKACLDAIQKHPLTQELSNRCNTFHQQITPFLPRESISIEQDALEAFKNMRITATPHCSPEKPTLKREIEVEKNSRPTKRLRSVRRELFPSTEVTPGRVPTSTEEENNEPMDIIQNTPF